MPFSGFVRYGEGGRALTGLTALRHVPRRRADIPEPGGARSHGAGCYCMHLNMCTVQTSVDNEVRMVSCEPDIPPDSSPLLPLGSEHPFDLPRTRWDCAESTPAHRWLRKPESTRGATPFSTVDAQGGW